MKLKLSLFLALVIFNFSAFSSDTKLKIGKIVTLIGIAHNTKDGVYLNDYVIDDFQLPDPANGKKIELKGVLQDMKDIDETPKAGKKGEISQGREGMTTHLKIKNIKWTILKAL